MASGDHVADREEPVSTALLREAQQYRTVQTVQRWPVVSNGTTALLDGYQSLKKEGDLARVVLNASEELLGLVCRSAVLPLVRSPLLKSPLRMADWLCGTGAKLLQKAVPRLTDTKQPLRLNAELLMSLLMVPLTLSVALSRDLLQFTVSWLVANFPSLKPAAAGFSEKSLLGQCGAVALLLWVYLPLQLLSRPAETAVSWLREAVGAAVNEVSLWSSSVSLLAVRTATWVAATAQTAYYVLFVMTGLEPVLESVLGRARLLLQGSRNGADRIFSSVTAAVPVSGLANRVANSDLAPVRWLRELWCGADSQRAEGGEDRAARSGGGPC